MLGFAPISSTAVSKSKTAAAVLFAVDIRALNLTIPKADEDPLEQQRILIENLILIQQALRNLGQ